MSGKGDKACQKMPHPRCDPGFVPVVLGQDVIWGDMDAFGHINNEG
jgi:hypothetical protein